MRCLCLRRTACSGTRRARRKVKPSRFKQHFTTSQTICLSFFEVRLHYGLVVMRRILQQVEQFDFESRVNFAVATGFWRIGQTVQAMLLPNVESAAHSFRMHVTQRSELFQNKVLGGKQGGLCSQPMNHTNALVPETPARRLKEQKHTLCTDFTRK